MPRPRSIRLFYASRRADGIMQQVTFRIVGIFQMTQFQPVEACLVKGGQRVNRRDHLIIAKVFNSRLASATSLTRTVR